MYKSVPTSAGLANFFLKRYKVYMTNAEKII